LVIFAHDTRF